MHDLLLALYPLAEGTPEISSNSDNGILIAIIITAGTVVSGALALIVGSLQREKPRRELTQEQKDAARRAAQQDRMVGRYIADLIRDKTAAEKECETVSTAYNLLRDAVFRHGLDPDELIKETP